ANALIERSDHVGKPGSARVVEMRRMEAMADLCSDLAKQPAHLGRVGIAYSIGECDAIGACIDASFGKLKHRVFAHSSLDGAAEGSRKANVDTHRSVARVAQAPDFRELDNHLRGRSLHVGKTVGLAHGDGNDYG